MTDEPDGQHPSPGAGEQVPPDEERRAERARHRLAQMRALWVDRSDEPVPAVVTGPSDFRRAQVPFGVDLAAAWAWRFLVIAAAGYLILWVSAYFAVITLPIVIALLVAALATPVVDLLHEIGLARGLSAGLVMVGGILMVSALLTFAGQQVANGANDLATQTVKGLEEIKDWLQNGPLNASDSQINGYIEAAQNAITDWAKNGEFVGQVTEVGTAVGHVFAGFFIVLFATYFMMADGGRIWAWFVRLAPRAARAKVDGSGRVAWRSLTQFVRATVLVALVDAIGIMIVAAILGVPFVAAIGVLVFLGAFIPMVGATVAGAVAVLVALVDQGPITALLMLGGVILVQQIEGHVLQPFLMGRFVSVHPLGVIVAIGCGVVVAGIAGALVAVPFAAVINAVVQYLAGGTDPGDDPEEALAADLAEVGPREDIDDPAADDADGLGS